MPLNCAAQARPAADGSDASGTSDRSGAPGRLGGLTRSVTFSEKGGSTASGGSASGSGCVGCAAAAGGGSGGGAAATAGASTAAGDGSEAPMCASPAPRGFCGCCFSIAARRIVLMERWPRTACISPSCSSVLTTRQPCSRMMASYASAAACAVGNVRLKSSVCPFNMTRKAPRLYSTTLNCAAQASPLAFVHESSGSSVTPGTHRRLGRLHDTGGSSASGTSISAAAGGDGTGGAAAEAAAEAPRSAARTSADGGFASARASGTSGVRFCCDIRAE